MLGLPDLFHAQTLGDLGPRLKRREHAVPCLFSEDTREIVEPLQRPQHGIRRARLLGGWNDLEQQLVAARLDGIVERARLRFIFEPVVDGGVGSADNA